MLQRQDLFTSGTQGVHTFRIPSLVTTHTGTVLAFCEARMHGRRDDGEIRLMLRRSGDGGITWEPAQVVVAESGMTCGNPCPVVSVESGVVWLLFCKNAADRGEDVICRGEAARTVWLTSSPDHGETWATPREITADVMQPDWTWYATGPGHGIQLASKRLAVPCDHIVGRDFNRRTDPHHAHIIVSDDQGITWRVAGVAEEGTNECAIVELADESIYLNARGNLGTNCRAVTRSHDRGATFGDLKWETTLVEPTCQGSMIQHPTGATLFANPASTVRERLTVRASLDNCKTWNAGRVLESGPSAYSDLTDAADGAVLCLFERGIRGPYERLTLARFDLNHVVGC